MLPEEVAAVVLCGLNHSLGDINRITGDWNANRDKQAHDFADIRERLQGVLASI